MTGEPSLTVTSTAYCPLVGFVHSGMKVRTIFANTMADLERRLVSVCIAEFGMGSDDSAAFAAASVATPAQQFAALQAQFDDTVAKFAAAESHVALLQDELTEAQTASETLRAQLAAATAPTAPSQPNPGADGGETAKGATDGAANAATGAESAAAGAQVVPEEQPQQANQPAEAV